MATGDRGDECFFRIYSGRDRKGWWNGMGRRRRRDLNAAVEQPAMFPAVAVVRENRSVPLPRDCGCVFAQRSVRAPALPAAHGGENQDSAPLRSSRAQPVKEANAFSVDENVDVSPHTSLLVHDPVKRPRRLPAESCECFPDCGARFIEMDGSLRPRVRAQRSRQFYSDHDPAVTDAFTHTTGGNPSAISDHVVPSLAEAKTFPLRVPK